MGWLLSLKPRQRLQLSLTMGTAGTEDMVDTVLEDTGDTMASERLRLSLTTDTEATVVDTEAMVDSVTAGATMASVRLMPNPRLLLSLTTDTVDTEATEDTDMVDTVLATAGATTASVRLRPSPTTATEGTVEDMEATGATVASVVATTASVRPRLSPTMAMEDMVDIVLVDTEATEATVMAMASNMFPNCSTLYNPSIAS